MARSYDLVVAKANMDQEIADTARRLKELEKGRAWLDKQGDDLMTGLSLLNKFGKAATNGHTPIDITIDPSASLNHNVLTVLEQAGKPLRAKAVVDLLQEHGITATQKVVRDTLVHLVMDRKARRMGMGVYGALKASKQGAAKAAAVLKAHAEQEPAKTKSNGKLPAYKQARLKMSKWLDTFNLNTPIQPSGKRTWLGPMVRRGYLIGAQDGSGYLRTNKEYEI